MKTNKLAQYFKNEIITVLLKGFKVRTRDSQQDILLCGILLDECSEYIYLGKESEIDVVIDKTAIQCIFRGDVDLTQLNSSEDNSELQ